MRYMTAYIIIISLLFIAAPCYGEDGQGMLKESDALPFTLLATVDANSFAFAVIKDKNTNKEVFYEVGDKIQDFEIARILRARVVLLKGGRPFVLEFPFGAVSETVISLSETERIVNKKALLRRIPAISEGLKIAKPLPYIKRGKIEGIRLSSIKDTQLFDRLGLQEGDVILKVNGEKIDTLKKPFQLYHKLKNNDIFTIEVKKPDGVRTLTYHISP